MDADHQRLWQARVFLAAADARSFREAAAELKRQPSAVSAAIKTLETDALGSKPLFTRLRGGSVLSPEGEALLPAARHLVAAADEFEAATRRIAQRITTRRIATIQGAWFDLIARAQHHLGDTVRLEPIAVDPYWPVRPLLTGAADYALLPAPSDHDSKLVRRPIFTEPRYVTVSTERDYAQGASAPLDEIDTGTWIGSPPGADRTFTAAHRCDDIRGGPPPHTPGAFVLNPIEIGAAVRAGRIQLGAMRSISKLFAGAADGTIDVAIEDAPPWQIDLVATRSSTSLRSDEMDELADAIRRAVVELGVDDQTVVDTRVHR